MREVNRNIPVIFEKVKNYDVETEDIRFLKVRIWILHTMENFNGSYFSKEVVEDAIPSLANTPILAYIEENSEGEEDFSDHREVLIKINGQYKIKYIGQAIGVIPQDNNAHFEMRMCDTGQEKEYLVVDGLVWKKWDDPIDIFERDKVHNQSMELSEDYEGNFQEDGFFHFTKFKFFGACCLSNNVEPAMINSTVEVQFSENDFQNEIQLKMEQFKKYMLDNSTEQNKMIDTPEKDINIKNKDEGGNKMAETKFSLSNEQLIAEIYKQLSALTVVLKDYWGDPYETNQFYYQDIKDNYVIVIANTWDSYYGIPFTTEGDVVTLDFDNKVEYVPDWRPKEDGVVSTVFNINEKVNEIVKYSVEKAIETTKTQFNVKETEDYKAIETQYTTEKTNCDAKVTELGELQTKYSALEQEVTGLKEFKATREKTERETKVNNVFSEFSFEEDEVKELKEKAYNGEIEIESLKEKLFTLEGKKAHEQKKNFSKNEKKDSTTIKITQETKTDENIYGEADKYFNK